MPPSLRLPIVPAGEELSTAAPRIFERAARSCAIGSTMHRGIVLTAATVARFGARACVVPSAVAPVIDAVGVAEGWASGTAETGTARRARSDAFNAARATEQKTVDAVAKAIALTPTGPPTELDEHASSVVLRYAGLAASLATQATLSCLDAIDDPALAADVLEQAAGALAYRDAGLGLARSSDLRARAWERAGWESERAGAPEGHGTGALAVQLFHEFLGSRWKDVSDAHRARFGEFVEWALDGAR